MALKNSRNLINFLKSRRLPLYWKPNQPLQSCSTEKVVGNGNVFQGYRVSYELTHKPYWKQSLIVLLYSCSHALVVMKSRRNFNICYRTWNREVRINGSFNVRTKHDNCWRCQLTANVLSFLKQQIPVVELQLSALLIIWETN